MAVPATMSSTRLKELQIGEGEGDESEKSFREPAAAVFLQPVFARRRLEMADEINENHHHDRKDVRGSEGGNEEG